MGDVCSTYERNSWHILVRQPEGDMACDVIWSVFRVVRVHRED
jgi:hypothetical protein